MDWDHRERSSVRKLRISMLSMSESVNRPRSRRRCRHSLFSSHSTFPLLISWPYRTVSNQNNKSRLQLLSLREELLEESFDEARKGLKSTVDDEGKYETVLKGLILQVRDAYEVAFSVAFADARAPVQGLYSLMEKDVKIVCRSKDASLVNKAKDEAASEFKEAAGFEVKLSVLEELPKESYVTVPTGRSKLIGIATLQSWRCYARRVRWSHSGRQHP